MEAQRISIRLNEQELAQFRSLSGTTDAERFRILLKVYAAAKVEVDLDDTIKSDKRIGRKRNS